MRPMTLQWTKKQLLKCLHRDLLSQVSMQKHPFEKCPERPEVSWETMEPWFLKRLFNYLKERERERKKERGKAVGGGRWGAKEEGKNLKKNPCWMRSFMWGLISGPEIKTWAKIKIQTLNWLNHPGTPWSSGFCNCCPGNISRSPDLLALVASRAYALWSHRMAYIYIFKKLLPEDLDSDQPEFRYWLRLSLFGTLTGLGTPSTTGNYWK